jgi:hypothetical protein
VTEALSSRSAQYEYSLPFGASESSSIALWRGPQAKLPFVSFYLHGHLATNTL